MQERQWQSCKRHSQLWFNCTKGKRRNRKTGKRRYRKKGKRLYRKKASGAIYCAIERGAVGQWWLNRKKGNGVTARKAMA